jgi:hypothetical protein
LSGNFSINVFGFLPESTQISIGNWANNLYASNSLARAALDHPYAPAVIGAAPLAAYGAVVAAPVVADAALEAGNAALDSASAIATKQGAIKAAVGAGISVGNTYMDAKIEGRKASLGEYVYAAGTGALSANLKGGALLKAGFAGAVNIGGQRMAHKRVDPVSVAISSGSAAASSGLLRLGSSPEFYKDLTEQIFNFTLETPFQSTRTYVQKSNGQKKK